MIKPLHNLGREILIPFRPPGPGPWILIILAGAVLAAGATRPTSSPSSPAIGATEPATLPGLHNVFRVSRKLYQGSSPEGEAGFASLQALGVRTVISVDGMQPDVALARRFGLRYVHLPISYDGCPAPRSLEIARAVRDLPGPIYLHCHHGKHRSAAAAALVHITLDGATNAEAVRFMRRAGADPAYSGLYASVASFRRPTAAEIDRAPARFPEVAAIPPLAATMVRINDRFEALQQSRRDGWRDQGERRDALPAHEALQLRELFRELQRAQSAADHPRDYSGWMRAAEGGAAEMETALRAGDAQRADVALDQVAAACGACHARYRNVPQPR